MKALRPIIVTGLAGVWLLACGDAPSTPKQEIKRAIALGVQAAEERDLGKLGDLVAEDYQDDKGYDRRSLLRLAQAYLIGHRSIHLFTRTRSIEISAPKRATAVILVAMAGEPVQSSEHLINIRADLYQFEIVFVGEGDSKWRATGGHWQRASIDDFL